jgi:hypothetical protein
VGLQKSEDIMKVKFINDHIIYRVPIETLVQVIVDIASKDGEEYQAVAILETKGWTKKELQRFDNEWDKALHGLDPLEIEDGFHLYDEVKKHLDLNQFWCMK